MHSAGANLIDLYRRVRARTEALAAPLGAEDQLVQSMPSASPTKWHRAHTTWFFETFLLAPNGVAPHDPRYGTLFNSYYEAIGARHARPKRGLLSRPTLDEVTAYRSAIDAKMIAHLTNADASALTTLAPLVRLGCAHEEQHQELVLTDVLHAFSENPMRPAYRRDARHVEAVGDVTELGFVTFDGGLESIGARDGEAFVFDNELPRHQRFVQPFALADRLVTVRELVAFVADRGYETASLWLSDGWDWVRENAVRAPMHARIDGGACVVFGLDGEREARPNEPVVHVSFYEADAIARWLGARLPTESEWEVAASRAAIGSEANLLDTGALRPRAARSLPEVRGGVRQLFGDAWEWTRSSYEPYPGYAPASGALGEYNGKFMVSQLVLRGGSCFTPRDHVRASYRNFWTPDTRFQMTGVRVARDV